MVYGISFHHMADAVRVPAASDTGNPGSVHGLSAAEEGKCGKYNQPGDLMTAITAAVAVLSVVQAVKQIFPWIAGIAVYVLAAVLMAVSCVCLYQDLRNNVINKIIISIKKNPLGERFLDDHAFRTILTTLPTFLINVAYTIYNGVIGIMNQSVWFITMAVY